MTGVYQRATKVLEASAGLLRTLSTTQKLALGVVAALVITALAVVASGGPTQGVLARSTAGGTGIGTPGTSTPGSSTLDSARTLDVARNGGPKMDLGFFGMETPEFREAARREANCRKLEQLVLSRKVEAATVIYSPAPVARRVLDENPGDSALLKLVLKEGVGSLERQEADAIRDMAIYALGLRPDRVSIVDNHNKSYSCSREQASPAELYADEQLLRRDIRELIREYYSNLFNESEFYVGVIVYTSQEHVEIEKEEFDRNGAVPKMRMDDTERVDEIGGEPILGGIGGFGAASGAGGTGASSGAGGAEVIGGLDTQEKPRRIVVKSKTEEEFLPSKSKTRTRVPRGSVKGVSVSVLLDLEAVQRVQRKLQLTGPSLASDGYDAIGEGDCEPQLIAFREGQEAILRNLLSGYGEPSVRVVVQPFEKAEPRATGQSASGPLVAGTGGGASASGSSAASDGSGGRFSWMLPLACGAALLIVLAGVAQAVRAFARREKAPRLSGTLPGSRAGPSADVPCADKGLRWSVDEALRCRGERAGNLRRAGRFQDGLLGTVDAMSRSARRRPEVAASVLRCWLAQDAEVEPAEGARRT